MEAQTSAQTSSRTTKVVLLYAIMLTNTILDHLHILILLQKALKERGIDTMLDEARRDTGEADSEHLRKS